MKTAFLCGLIGVFAPATVMAGTRSSADYTITADTLDAGGGTATSAAYSNKVSTGGVAGISTTSPALTVKHGYVAQLFEATGITLTAPEPTLAETGSLPLQASLIFDDATTQAVSPAAVSWSILGGPLTGISGSGLVTAGIVYEDTDASVQGQYQGFTAPLDLIVLCLCLQ